MKERGKNLTSGRLLAHNTVWNLLGQFLPMLAGLACVPPLVRGLGDARFGLLSLAWILVGYFSLFDLGVGKALTKLVAEKIGSDEDHEVAPLVWTSLLLMLVLGLVGASILFLFSRWLIQDVLRVPEALQKEVLSGLHVLAMSLPLVTLTSGLRGILEAYQRFRMINLIRVPTSVFLLAGPLLALPFSHSLVPAMWMLLAGRVIAFLAYLWACLRATPHIAAGLALDRSAVIPLVRFGGWLTVANIVGPALVYMDRFLIGARLSVSAVAYYSAPFDVVNRLLVIPTAVIGVLFPAFTVTLSQDPNRTALLLRRSVKYIFLTIFPIVLAIVTFAPEGLRLWLGPVFAERGGPVLRWLATAVLLNSLTVVPFVMIQSAGKPDFTGKLCIAELPVYVVALWLLIPRFGIEGAAIASLGRIVCEGVILFAYAHRLLRTERKMWFQLTLGLSLGLGLLLLGTLPANVSVKAAFFIMTLLSFIVIVWIWGLGPAEKTLLARDRAGSVMDRT